MLSGAEAGSRGRILSRKRPQMVAIPEEHEMCEFEVVHIWIRCSLRVLLICEIYVMWTGYLIAEFYYGLCDDVIVSTLYWCGYGLQNCYLKEKSCMTLISAIENIMYFIWII